MKQLAIILSFLLFFPIIQAKETEKTDPYEIRLMEDKSLPGVQVDIVFISKQDGKPFGLTLRIPFEEAKTATELDIGITFMEIVNALYTYHGIVVGLELRDYLEILIDTMKQTQDFNEIVEKVTKAL